MLKGISMTQPVAGTNQDGASARLKGICAEFESIFMTYMLKSMRSAMVEDGIMGNSHESKIMTSMFDENLALELANGGGIGLGKVLFERLAGATGISSQGDEPAREKTGYSKEIINVYR
jgi:Rod binding domain-containing protein